MLLEFSELTKLWELTNQLSLKESIPLDELSINIPLQLHRYRIPASSFSLEEIVEELGIYRRLDFRFFSRNIIIYTVWTQQ